jgi:T4-like virus Myoviridae tail sheath stabiliser
MSDYFYDGQIRRYVTQFMRVMSNFSYKDGKGKLIQVPVRYGDLSRQAATVLKKGSENVLATAPFIACYIKDFKYDRLRLQDPTFVSKINIRERDVDGSGNLLNTQGGNYTVERIMPSPYKIMFAADLWTTNTEQKFQIIEQIACIFNPALDLQTTDNYVDWTSLGILSLTDQGSWSSRTVPQGLDDNIEISNLIFEAPVWITPPAKVKQMNIITKIINNVFVNEEGVLDDLISGYENQILPDSNSVIVTPGDFNLLVLNGVATLEPNLSLEENIELVNPPTSWLSLLNLYPGKFVAGLSQLRLTSPNNNEIIAFMSLDPVDETRMILNFDTDTIPQNTVINGRTTIDAIVNPETFNPKNKVVNTRYLILEDINSDWATPGYSGPTAWKNNDGTDPVASANDIIEWDGAGWAVIFNSNQVEIPTYITNSYTGIQYKWDGINWSKSFEGVYDKALWRLIL